MNELSEVRREGPSVSAFARVIWRRRPLVAGVLALSLAVSALLSLILPKTYDSIATVLAPREGAGGLFGGVAATALLQQVPLASVPSLTPNRDMLVSVLKSRTVAQAAVDAFHLRDRYRVRYQDDAIIALKARMEVSLSREGVIAVRVEDTDPAMAAQIANFLMAQLDRLVSQYSVGEASHQRSFMTVQLARAKSDLETMEEALRRFQERNRAVVLQEQTRGAIEGAARLKGEIMAAEVQMQVLRGFATEANPEVIVLRRRIEEMRRQLGQMQYGDEPSRAPLTDTDRREIYVPVARLPGVGMELARLTRDVRVHETLVTLLTQQLEQAKIAEAKDFPMVQVLDRATPAERPSRPRLSLNLAVGGVSGLIAGLFLALIIEHYKTAPRRAA